MVSDRANKPSDISMIKIIFKWQQACKCFAENLLPTKPIYC